MLSDPNQTLRDIFGFSSFRSAQEELVNQILDRNNLIAVMPTGSGKSLCYQLPALLFEGRTIVVSPLIALMNDQVAYLKSLNISADTIHSHRDYDENAKTWRAFVRADVKILYTSPERLMTERVLHALEKIPVDLFVIDEAHCISKWGAGFRPEYQQLSRLQELFPNATLAAFTATADKMTRTDISDQLTGGSARIIVKGFDRPNLSLSVALRSGWKKKVLEFLKYKKELSGIVYTLSRKETETVAQFLNDNGFQAVSYHAGQDRDFRQNSQNRFMTETGLIMVATIAFGMGIDKPDIRFVIHTNLPGSVEAFYQEIGRAGRDGQPSDTMLLYGLDDLVKRRYMIRDNDGDEQHKLRENKRLDSLLAYCEASGCRKKALLGYFDELTDNCGNCDNCINHPELVDGTEQAQILMSAILRTGEYFGAVHVVNVVRGISTEKIRQRNHDQIPTFGKGAELPNDFWHALIRQLLASGKIVTDLERFGALRILQEGRQIIAGEETFFCKKITSQKGVLPSRKKLRVIDIQSDQDQSMLLKLKELRLDLARQRNIPAFIIFSDRTLMDMVRVMPKTREEMLEVNGVGPQKLEQYGDQFLEQINTD